jgi:hypothetical protein
VKVVPLYDAPQHAEQVIEWLWREFGDSLPRAFFESIIDHSQTPGNLPLTFVLVDGDTLLGTVGLWRCDLISRQDLFPGWRRSMLMSPYAGRGWRVLYSSM